jgi:HAE1 family hydrophobic/amphiphilic exporter-1
MGVAVIGGLLASTALSLFVVPVLFTLTDDLQKKLQRIWSRRDKTTTEAQGVSVG